MKTRGIVYLAFGKEYDKLTTATAEYSRRFTKLPMCVLTNLKEQNTYWKNVSDVCFKYISLPSEKNRRIKVSLLDYTPYDETLFIDSDAVIQNYNIESLFDYLKNFDVACQYCGTTVKKDSNLTFYKKTYGKLAKLLKESYPIEILSTVALLFRKTETSQKFFALWKEYWKLMGCSRDMPAFTFAVKHTKTGIKIFRTLSIVMDNLGPHSNKWNRENMKLQDIEGPEVPFLTDVENNISFIQHEGFKNFQKKFGLPSYTDWSPKL